MAPTPAASAPGFRSWIPTLVFNVALPIATYSVLKGQGVGTVVALALSGVWPLFELLYTVFKRGHADEFSIFALILVILGVATSLIFNNARSVLLKDSAVTGLFGIVLLGSLFFSRPLMFYFGRRFATDGSPEGIAYWDGLWQYPGFRRGQRILTLVWGLAFVGEALVRILLTYVLSVSTMVVVTNVMPYVVLAALIFGTVRYGNKRRRAMEAAVAAL